MASGETETFYCGTYIRGRIRWETQAVSGGHNVSLYMDVYRTNIYYGDIANNRQTDKLYCDGQTSEWYNTTISNQRTWHQLFSMTKFVGHSAAKTISIGWSTTCTESYYNGSWNGTITLEAIGQKASGLSVTFGDKTWNSIKISGSISSWGVGPGPNYVALAVFPGGKNVNSWGGPRLEWTADNQGSTRNWTNRGPATIPLEGGLTVKGCMPYKVGIWANNRYEAAWLIRNEVGYTPPAPPVKMEVISDIPFNKTHTHVTIRVTESAENNFPGAMVKTRIYIGDSADKYDSDLPRNFTSAKHTPGTPVDFVLTLHQNTSYSTINSTSVFYYGENDRYSIPSDWTNGPIFENGRQQSYVTKQIEPAAIDYEWNDTRTILTVKAKPGSDYTNYMDVKWGYTDTPTTALWSGNVPAGSATSDWQATATIPYPDHGAGQFIYVKARSRYRDNTWEDGDLYAIPVPNPILGVATYTNQNKKYIVDVVEHKSDNTVTPLWQNGPRIVKK